MKLISSRQTFFLKRAYPFAYLATAALWIAGVLFIGASASHPVPWPYAVFPPIFLVLLLLVGRVQFRKYADEVWLCSDETLIIRKSGREDRVDLSNVDKVRWSNWRPANVTLTFKRPGVFGDTLVFASPVRLAWGRGPA